MSALVAVQILIPVLGNTSRLPFPADVVAAWEDEAIARFGAFTRVGMVTGVWTSTSGLVVTDESRCYLICVEASRLDDLRAFAAAACVTFDQECIFFQVVGTAELIYPPGK
jgi:hypothetical protein